MKLFHLLSLTLLPVLSSCAPTVLTNVMKAYPSIPTDSVVIFEPGTPLPNSAEPLGRVMVQNNSASFKCQHEKIVQVAVEETAKMGGNGLALIDYYGKPGRYRNMSCDQVRGVMIYMKDMVIDSLSPNPVMKAIELTQTMAEEQRRKRQAPYNTILASVGYGWITSRLYSPAGDRLSSVGGMEWQLSYERVFNSGWGFGFQYSGFRSDSPFGNMRLNYVAPTFLTRTKLNQWIFSCGIGVGVFFYNDEIYHSTGAGFNADLGVEYMVSKNIGLGVSLNAISGSLPKQEGFDYNDDETSGIARVSLKGGIRFYF